jgi:hypothetical protein
MSGPVKPIKVVLTASICVVASAALQGTTTNIQPNLEQQWKAVQQIIADSDVPKPEPAPPEPAPPEPAPPIPPHVTPFPMPPDHPFDPSPS